MLISLFLAIALLLPASTAFADTRLSGKEIKQLVSNSTAIGHRKLQGRKSEYLVHTVVFKTYFNANGELVEKVDSTGGASSSSGGSGYPAHGQWKVANGKLCFSFRDSLVDKGKLKCLKVLKKAGGSYELTKGSGEVNRVWKEVLPGNPYKLK
ncbi:hypothetical protein JV46_04920 [Solemya velum gill symbiont]|uniref:Uncharacterized protein n=1 Tax=Solemya velum gill symbiont TaxID=2340 RepID=A0A0B0HC85_SOVGS|nr:hypothetical protein JV46_04920 [Solemya velum gill symbiont]